MKKAIHICRMRCQDYSLGAYSLGAGQVYCIVSQLAVAIGASNPSKVGSLIRSFELGDPLSDHWLQALVEELQPDPSDLHRCLRLDQEETQRQLEQERLAWEAWAWDRAEDWAAAELKRFRAKGFLSWSRRERTWFDRGGLTPRRQL